MFGSHGIDKQQLQQRILIAHAGKVALAPAFESAKDFADTIPIAGPYQCQIERHFAPNLDVCGLTLLAVMHIGGQILWIIRTQLHAAQLWRITPAQLLQAGAQKAQLKRQARLEQ